ncbi:MAG: bifunctional 2-polyprenyl-6-hydroxyphenol methylase/3-demethylubiquinol 3-O-methyltransferase UbiG, partial [Hyphomicrobiaceae bacterium]
MQSSAAPEYSADRAATGPNADPDEVERFGRLADKWWDASGVFRPLHQLAPARLDFIRETILRELGLTGSGI